MTVQGSEITDLLNKANPADPTTASEAQQQTQAQIQTAVGALQGAGFQDKSNPFGQTKKTDTDMSANKGDNRSFSQRFFDAVHAPANGQPLNVMQLFTKAGTQAMNNPQPTELDQALGGMQGSTPWGQAENEQSNETQPSQQPNLGPSMDKASVVRRTIEGNLGDLAAANQAPSGLAGLAKTAKASSDRQENEVKDKIAIADANARMLHEQILVHKIGEDALNDATASGQAGLKTIMSSHVPGTIVAENKTSSELNKMIQDGQMHPSTQTAFLTGKELVGKDANGLPIFRGTYTVVEPRGNLTVTPGDAKFIKQNLGIDLQPDQQLSSAQMNRLWQQAQSAEVTIAARNKSLYDNEISTSRLDALESSKKIATNSIVTQVMGQVMSGPDDPNVGVKTYNKIAGSPDLLKKLQAESGPNAMQALKLFLGGGDPADADKNFDKLQERYAQDQDKAAQKVNDVLDKAANNLSTIQNDTAAVMAAAQNVINDPDASSDKKAQARTLYNTAKATQDLKDTTKHDEEINKETSKLEALDEAEKRRNPQGLKGPEFLASVPAGRRDMLTKFNNGQLVLSDRTANTAVGQMLLGDLADAYPGFDVEKAKSYAQMRLDYTAGKGQNSAAAQIKAYNTAFGHLNGLYDLGKDAVALGKTGSFLQFIGQNRDLTKARADIEALAPEIAKITTGGVPGMTEVQHWRERLDPSAKGQTGQKYMDTMDEVARLLGERVYNLQEFWDTHAPSPEYHPPIAIASPESMKTYKKVRGVDLNVPVYQGEPNSADSDPVTGMPKVSPGPNQRDPKKFYVAAPDGHDYPFDSQAQADTFKKMLAAHAPQK